MTSQTQLYLITSKAGHHLSKTSLKKTASSLILEDALAWEEG